VGVLVEMAGEAVLVGIRSGKTPRIHDVLGGRRFGVFTSRAVARLAGLALPLAAGTELHGVMRVFLKRVEDILVTGLAGFRPDVLRTRLLRIGGDCNYPQNEQSNGVLILGMGLVDRECSVRAMTNPAALSDRTRICQRM
jgi:hypothetical protein